MTHSMPRHWQQPLLPPHCRHGIGATTIIGTAGARITHITDGITHGIIRGTGALLIIMDGTAVGHPTIITITTIIHPIIRTITTIPTMPIMARTIARIATTEVCARWDV